jgi:hypothetical protein
MEVALSVTLALLTVIAGLVAAGSDLASSGRKKRIAWLSVAVLLITTSLQAGREIKVKRQVDLANQFRGEGLPEADEASAAATLGREVFVADDEHAALHEFAIDGRSLIFKKSHPLFPCAGASLAQNLREDGVFDVTEVEAAAAFKDKIFLLSSHSPNEEGKRKKKREILLEVTVTKSSLLCVSRATTLNSLVEELPRYAESLGGKLAGPEPDINFEGLAVDPSGKMVIALRSPVLRIHGQPYAMALVTTVDDVFSVAKKAKPRALRLGPADEELGVTDVAYDQRQGEFILLGNAPAKSIVAKPRSWLWRDSGEPIQRPAQAQWTYLLPPDASAKPEAIALVGDSVFIFLDAPRFGGVRWFSRSDLGLHN